MTDRAVRNLEHLRGSASTARVLNLLRVWEENGDSRSDGAVRNPDWAARPVFRTHALSRSLIIKPRLRRIETDLFTGRRQVATKVVIPIDDEDLKTGGRYVFVNQIGFDFYDWAPGEVRLVTSWDQAMAAVDRLAAAIRAL